MTRRAPIAVFAVLVAINLLGVGFDSALVEWLSKPLLMPALLWLLLAHGVAEARTRPLLIVGLIAATVADIALLIPGEAALLTGMGFFAVMQVCFVVAYTRVTGVAAAWRARPWLPGAYLVFWLGFNAVMWTTFAEMAAPIAVYSLLLTVMAAAAATVSARVGAGGLLFLVSDLMIGLGIANLDFVGRDVAIMATYTAAQFLIVTGLTAARSPAATADRGASGTASL